MGGDRFVLFLAASVAVRKSKETGLPIISVLPFSSADRFNQSRNLF
jgi:hypothetical protein